MGYKKAPERCTAVTKAVAFYDAEVPRGCAPEGCGGAVMREEVVPLREVLVLGALSRGGESYAELLDVE